MGKKIKAKFGSTCPECNTSITEGTDIYYDGEHKNKNGKAIVCSNIDCYKKQGGSSIEFQKSGGGYSKPALTIPQMEERMKAIHEKALPLAIETVIKIRGMKEFKDLGTDDAVVAIESFTRTFGTPYMR